LRAWASLAEAHRKGARSDHKYIKASENGRMFMPLYQQQGEDAFFLVHEIKPIWLGLSKWLRKLNTHILMPYLPGINKY